MPLGLFKAEEPVEPEVGEAETGEKLDDSDLEYHIAKFGQLSAERHAQMDPRNPFTVATWGGYSAVIVRHGLDVAPILFATGEQVDLTSITFESMSFPYGHKIGERLGQLAIASALKVSESRAMVPVTCRVSASSTWNGRVQIFAHLAG